MAYYSPKPGGAASKRRVTLLLGLLLLVALLGVFNWLQSRNVLVPANASLSVSTGQAVVAHADAGTTPPLQPGDRATLQRGDEVRTGAGSKARLALASGETIDLGPQTRLSILELDRAQGASGSVAILALHQGTTLIRIRHALLPGMRFEIETPVVTVQARGDIFQCDVLDNGHVYVAAYSGVLGVSMGEQAIELQAGQAVDARLGQALVLLAVSQTPPPELVEQMPPPGPAEDGRSGAPANPNTPALGATLSDRDKTLFPSPAATGPASAEGTLYEVQPGDTLYSIARRFGIPWERIWEANKDTLTKPELLRAGQQLRIPR